MHSISYAITSLRNRIRVQQVGGLVFIKIRYAGCNSLCISWCITQK